MKAETVWLRGTADVFKRGQIVSVWYDKAVDTDPVVSAHGVKAVCATDEHVVLISGHKDFDEIVTLILKNNIRSF